MTSVEIKIRFHPTHRQNTGTAIFPECVRETGKPVAVLSNTSGTMTYSVFVRHGKEVIDDAGVRICVDVSDRMPPYTSRREEVYNKLIPPDGKRITHPIGQFEVVIQHGKPAFSRRKYPSASRRGKK
jgi:hypothetical protein